jgi:hypothetical protein
MAIPEAQLDTWSKQGSVQQSKTTYAAIKNVLESKDAPYYSKSYESFLQGSYCNDTNVYAESDVDIVIRLESTYYHDISGLSADDQAVFNAARVPASYGLSDFKKEVISWLSDSKNFGSTVKPGGKAVFIPASGSRRDADVLVAAQFRRYKALTGDDSKDFHKGVCFFFADGTRVENFPKQHSENCTSKHQETDGWFKPTVRVFKNMRNRMIDDGVLEEGVAPSYFIEGMLWNVPADKFGVSFEDTFVNCFNWILEADQTKLACANDLFWLVRDNSPVCWSTDNFQAYLEAARKFWTDW